MTDLRLILISMTALGAALTVSACGDDASTASPYAGGEPETVESGAAAAANGEDDAAETDSDTLDPLEIAARDACAAGDEGFAELLPSGAGFASRGPDARVHAAWNMDGRTHEAVIHSLSLEQDMRPAFDVAVADFMRRNLVAGMDRAGITGAYRYRDGRFCVVQTEAEAIEPLQAAVWAAEAALASAGE